MQKCDETHRVYHTISNRGEAGPETAAEAVEVEKIGVLPSHRQQYSTIECQESIDT